MLKTIALPAGTVVTQTFTPGRVNDLGRTWITTAWQYPATAEFLLGLQVAGVEAISVFETAEHPSLLATASTTQATRSASPVSLG
jgi:hypothetical protein